ncbi:hypothetical protein K474DRAFT_1665672 [Panus rudis PR-1116 ss-1]|nr:hypothetical protein K474DRAFT_1665672 [Panus rudis PR-1116 ss-1]
MERAVRLYDRCVGFTYLERDAVERPSWDPSPPVLFSQHTPSADSKAEPTTTIPRQFFRLYEAVNILPGVVKKVEINGAQVWDEQVHIALYESRTAVGVFVWKLKKFEEVVGDGGKRQTRVTESIRGECPWYLKAIVQTETRRGHK